MHSMFPTTLCHFKLKYTHFSYKKLILNFLPNYNRLLFSSQWRTQGTCTVCSQIQYTHFSYKNLTLSFYQITIITMENTDHMHSMFPNTLCHFKLKYTHFSCKKLILNFLPNYNRLLFSSQWRTQGTCTVCSQIQYHIFL